MNYIYALICPVENEVRYVGKTTSPEKRLRAHIKAAQSGRLKHHCARWIKRLLDIGLEPTMNILCRLPDDANWQAVEQIAIASAREFGMALTNITLGGEGVVHVDVETRKRQVENRKQTMSDPVLRAKWIAGITAAHASPDVKAKHRESAKKYWGDPAYKQRHHEAVTAPEALARRAVVSREIWSDPVRLAAHAAAMKDALSDPAVRLRMSAGQKAMAPELRAARTEAMKAGHANPVTKARMVEVGKEIGARPEVKRARSEKMKAAWADEAIRAKREAALRGCAGAISASMKEFWADPKKAAKTRAAQKAGWADPAKKEQRLASRNAMWADPVRRAELIEKQKAAWVKRKAAKDNKP